MPRHPQTSIETHTVYVYIEEIGYILSDGTQVNKLILGAIGRVRDFCFQAPELESQSTLAFNIFSLFGLSTFDIYILWASISGFQPHLFSYFIFLYLFMKKILSFSFF